jgi:hypothetical protein
MLYNLQAMAVQVMGKDVKVPNPIEYDNYAISMNSTTRFDTDSCPVKIDNCCTQTISGFRNDFIPGTLRRVNNLVVRGFSNSKTNITHMGTVQWTIVDDEGKYQHINI